MLDVVVRVVSPDVVTSPVSGARGAFVRLELVEEGEPVGAVILGDLVRFEGPSGRFDVVVRRMTVEVPFAEAVPLAIVPPELVPLLRNVRGRGVLGVREHVVVSGAALRLRGIVIGGELVGRIELFA